MITSIDKIVQQIQLIESESLHLYYNDKFVQETDVYCDTVQQKFDVTRPWNSETALLDLPKKLCQLFNIEKFEANLRLLLRGRKEEIIKRFKKYSIGIPTEKEIVSLKLSTTAGYSPMKFSPLFLLIHLI